MKKKRTRNNYVNNQKMYAVLVEYKNNLNESKLNNKPNPPIPNYIGECLMLIAKRLSNHSWFNGYHFKEEMVSDALENCILYFNNFDPAKSNNPFAYFTQIIKFAFRRRIEKERKQYYIRLKQAQNFSTLNDAWEDCSLSRHKERNEVTDDFIKSFEERNIKKRQIT